MVEGRKRKAKAGTGQAPRPPNAKGFETAPEFAEFKSVMRRLLQVPKAELDEHVKRAKEESPRRDNPDAQGRKKLKPE